ncbi:MAG: retroviral-like aspartic protease family protein [Nanoarchaeota archaeon]|nr:retroviral-like aspartic protease family protein [Nanoarchaeota archaeon]
MTITFRYKTVKRPDGTEVKTPSIPILLSEKENFETTALLDSGADISAMPKDLADILGLDLSGKRTPS